MAVVAGSGSQSYTKLARTKEHRRIARSSSQASSETIPQKCCLREAFGRDGAAVALSSISLTVVLVGLIAYPFVAAIILS